MTNEEFDNLWHHAEAKGTAHRLAQEYPAWDSDTDNNF